MSDTFDRMKRIVVDHFCAEPESITEGVSFVDDLGSDDVDIFQLVMAFEEEFDIEIPDDDAGRLLGKGSFGDVVEYISGRLRTKGIEPPTPPTFGDGQSPL